MQENHTISSVENGEIKPLLVRSRVVINTSASHFKQVCKDDPSLNKLFLEAKRDRKVTKGKPVLSWYEFKNETL